MGTPLADNIRKQAQKTANKSMTPTGASSAMAKQAAVSATGKAAAPGVGNAQSSVSEDIVAQQAEQQQVSVAEEVQSAGEQMAVTEETATVKQEGVDSDLKMQKLEADNKYNNEIASLTSQIENSTKKEEHDRAALEMKGTLMARRLRDKKYMQALDKVNKHRNLKTKEDFAIAMSQQGLSRDREIGDIQRKRSEMIANRAREKGAKLSMDELMAALGKSESDAAQSAKDAKTGAVVAGVTGAAKAGIDYGMSDSDRIDPETGKPVSNIETMFTEDEVSG